MKAAPLNRPDPSWAWETYRPDAARPWNLQRAAHLIRRAGFGGTWTELQQALVEGPAATIDRLIEGGAETGSFYQQARATIASLLGLGGDVDLPAWWLYVMIHTPHPLQEKLTLFWHGHFATSASKVTDQGLMLAQNELLRKHALGKFDELVRAMARDTAMLLWLDSATNRKSRPNENFAREVMELFCLGTGNYTERDIKEAARCFTGWEVHNNRFWFNRHQHDDGVKQVLGQRGNFDGDQLIDVLLRQPAAARFIVRKLFRAFVADESTEDTAEGTPNSTQLRPSNELIEPLAAQLRDGYDLARVVRTMLSSNYFFSEHALRRKIKSPVELGAGLVHSLEGHIDHYALNDDLALLGQQVFYPPTVKGWNGGREWINSFTLLSRTNMVGAIAGGGDPRYQRKLGLEKCPALADVAGDDRKLVGRLVDLLLTIESPAEVTAALVDAAKRRGGEDETQRRGRVVQAIASLPEFQLL